MNYKFCTECGTKIEKHYRVCINCGKPFANIQVNYNPQKASKAMGMNQLLRFLKK